MAAVLIATNKCDGIYQFRKEVVSALLAAGYSVVLSSPYDRTADYFRDLGCTFVETPLSRHGTNPVRDLGLLSFYRSLLKKYRPVCVLTYTIKPNVYMGMACASAHVPYLCNVTGLGVSLQKKGLLRGISLFLYRRGLRRAARVFFQNQENCDFMTSQGVVRAPVTVLPGSGVNLAEHSPRPYPESGNGVTILYVGRFMADKGMEEYGAAAARLKAAHPDVRILAVGKPEEEYRARWEEIVAEGAVTDCGTTDRIDDYYAQAHIVCMPSYHEGMNNVLLEACASARPVVTTDVPGCREACEDGVNGFLCRPADADDLYEKLEKMTGMVNSRRAEMGRCSRKLVEERFDRQTVVSAYMEAVRAAAGAGAL